MSLRNSFGTQRSKFGGNLHTIEIDAEALGELVLQTLPMHVIKKKKKKDDDDDDDDDSSTTTSDVDVLFVGLQERVRQLANHYRSQDHKLCNFQQQKRCKFCCNSRLDEIALALETIIQKTPSLPAEVTAEIHSKIGLLRQKQGNSSGAIQSFLKALWIQSSLPATTTTTPATVSSSESQTERNDILVFKIAMTKHRLGLAFARDGNFKDAVRLLQNAVEDYQAYLLGPHEHSHHHHHHHHHHHGNSPKCNDMKKILEQAQKALQNTTEALTLQNLLMAQKNPEEGGGTPPPPPFGRSKTICVVPPRRHKSAEEKLVKDRSEPTTTTTTTTRRRRASFATMA